MHRVGPVLAVRGLELLAQERETRLGGTNPPRVVVLPDGILYTVPWAALADGEGKALVDRVAVTVLPSLQTLALLRSEAAARAANRGSREDLCAMGGANYPGSAGE